MPRNNRNILTGKPRIALAKVLAMHADYQRGLSLRAVGRLHGHSGSCLRYTFLSRGLSVRAMPPNHACNNRKKNGQIRKARPASAKQIEQMIAEVKRVHVPQKLKREWRQWSMERRMWFIRRLRERFPSTRPKRAFSGNVVPFDYGTPAARQLVDKLNKGRNSQTKKAQLRPACEGVIWEGQLWYWCRNSEIQGDGYFIGTWKPERVAKGGSGRPSLHHTIWERHNKRKVPAGQTVVCLDGNKNNLDPKNLGLRSQADCARLNMRRFRTQNARKMTELLLSNHQNKESKREHKSIINAIHRTNVTRATF